MTSCLKCAFNTLHSTYNSIGFCSKSTDAGRTGRDLELGETPFGAEILGEKTGRCQAVVKEGLTTVNNVCNKIRSINTR